VDTQFVPPYWHVLKLWERPVYSESLQKMQAETINPKTRRQSMQQHHPQSTWQKQFKNADNHIMMQKELRKHFKTVWPHKNQTEILPSIAML
jgi:hypothetical protein